MGPCLGETSQGEVFSPPMRSKHMKALEMATHGNLSVGHMCGGSTWRFEKNIWTYFCMFKTNPVLVSSVLGYHQDKGFFLHLYPVIYQCTSLHFHHRGFSWQILVCQSHSYNHSLPNVTWVMSGQLSNNWTLFSDWEFNCQVGMLSTKATFSLGAWRCLCFQWPDAPHSTLSSRRA